MQTNGRKNLGCKDFVRWLYRECDLSISVGTALEKFKEIHDIDDPDFYGKMTGFITDIRINYK